jgi:xylan 1,4-beta-xylosidase
VRGEKYRYYYSFDGSNWNEIGPELDCYKLSDDYVEGPAFTGAFVGIACIDTGGTKLPRVYADFDYFGYVENCV